MTSRGLSIEGPYRRRPLWLRLVLGTWYFLRDFPANITDAIQHSRFGL